jgi:DNA-nicking Smr family endonuclease
MSRRRLDPDEHLLWKHVTRSIAPLAEQRRDDVEDIEPPAAPAPKVRKPQAKVKAKPAAAPVAARSVARPEPAPLARKAKRRLSRDNGAIHGRLDLHGMTQAQAHDALLGFLRRSQAKDARIVLVITGKGARGDSERGVLKRQVPMWLALPEFRGLVVGFGEAAVGHGGEGALYVRVRRAKGGG